MIGKLKYADLVRTFNMNSVFDVYPDYPVKGVNFIDIFPAFSNAEFKSQLTSFIQTNVPQGAILVVPEALGFIFLGMALNKISAVIPFRKKNKLPYKDSLDLQRVFFKKEYGSDFLECRDTDVQRAVKLGSKVIIVDDVLATGGTAKAMSDLLKVSYGLKTASFLFMIEIASFKASEELSKIAPVKSLIEV